MKFRVVLWLVPGLFYAKSLEINTVPWFHALSRAHAYMNKVLVRARLSYVNWEDTEHVEQATFSMRYGAPRPL